MPLPSISNPRSWLPLSRAVNWRTGAGTGAVLGGGLGLLRDPGTNPDGTPKSRLSAAAKGAIGGAAVGGGIGALNTRFVQPKLMKSVYGDKAQRVEDMATKVKKMNKAPDKAPAPKADKAEGKGSTPPANSTISIEPETKTNEAKIVLKARK